LFAPCPELAQGGDGVGDDRRLVGLLLSSLSPDEQSNHLAKWPVPTPLSNLAEVLPVKDQSRELPLERDDLG